MRFHLTFKLDADGEAILLFDPEGRLVDEVTFGKQKTDEAMGRPSDNGVPKRLAMATPGLPNDSHAKSAHQVTNRSRPAAHHHIPRRSRREIPAGTINRPPHME